jgi:hypothetical protein
MVKQNWNNLGLPRKQTATFIWSADYAAHVHEGSVTQSGTELPARPWVDVTVEEFDFAEELQEAVKESSNFRSAFDLFSDRFGHECQQNLEDERWDWPRLTIRSDGSVATSPRDIVDTGNLRDSYSKEIS